MYAGPPDADFLRPYSLPVSYRTLFKRFEELLFEHDGKPHWAKSHNTDRAMLNKMFPHTSDFLAVRTRLDPLGIFLNPYARRHFYGETAAECDPAFFKSTLQRLENKLT